MGALSGRARAALGATSHTGEETRVQPLNPFQRPPTEAPRRQAYGVGFSYRATVHEQVMALGELADFLELPAEDYVDARVRQRFDPQEALLAEAAARYPVVAHGNAMSLGTAQPLDEVQPGYLERVERFVARTPVSAYSEHLAFTQVGQRGVKSFLALPYTDLGVAAAAANARALGRRLGGLPVLLENVTCYFPVPGAAMAEHEFLRRVVEQADCGILLDVCNLHINSTNHGYDPRAFIDALPGERVRQAHFCGYTRPDPRVEPRDHAQGWLEDTHYAPTQDPIWELLDYAVRRTDLDAIILERDRNLTAMREVSDDLWRAREVFYAHRPRVPLERPTGAVTWGPPINEPDETDDPQPYAEELLRFQEGLLRLLTDPALQRELDRLGEDALEPLGLGTDERRALAGIAPEHRRRLARHVAHDLRTREEESRAALERDLSGWATGA
jgi:uncharacterized protein